MVSSTLRRVVSKIIFSEFFLSLLDSKILVYWIWKVMESENLFRIPKKSRDFKNVFKKFDLIESCSVSILNEIQQLLKKSPWKNPKTRIMRKMSISNCSKNFLTNFLKSVQKVFQTYQFLRFNSKFSAWCKNKTQNARLVLRRLIYQ